MAAACLAFAACHSSIAAGPPTDAGCSIDAHGGPSTQIAALIGAYYFDGWSGGIGDYHLHQLINGTDGLSRQPLSGWEDKTSCQVEQQVAWARSYGVSFFVFDWFYPPTLSSCYSACWYLNGALDLYRALPDKHGMRYAIVYVDQSSFTVSPANWPDAVSRWVTLFQDPEYLRVDGKPIFVVIDLYNMFQAFGSSHANVKAALDSLRSAAQEKGIGGVLVVGGFGVANGAAFDDAQFYDLASYEAEGYDAFTMYSYGNAPTADAGPQPVSLWSDTAQWIWTQTLRRTALPSIPIVTLGWDARPESFEELPARFPPIWFDPSPQEAADLVRAATDWAEAHPASKLATAPSPPFVMVDAWNELLEGSYLVPTVTRQHSIGDAIAVDLARGSDRTRSVLTLGATPADAGPPLLAFGSLLDDSGHPLAGDVSISARALDGAGLVGRYSTSGVVPTAASTAYVVAEANRDGLGPGPAQAALYSVDFRQPGDSASRVPNGDFSSGATGWSFVGNAAYAPDGGLSGGVAVALQAPQGEGAWAGSGKFPVAADAGFSATFVGRVSPASASNGEWFVAFFDSGSTYVGGASILFRSATADAGTAATDGGAFSLDVTSLGSDSLAFEAFYDGGPATWPAVARSRR